MHQIAVRHRGHHYFFGIRSCPILVSSFSMYTLQVIHCHHFKSSLLNIAYFTPFISKDNFIHQIEFGMWSSQYYLCSLIYSNNHAYYQVKIHHSGLNHNHLIGNFPRLLSFQTLVKCAIYFFYFHMDSESFVKDVKKIVITMTSPHFCALEILV